MAVKMISYMKAGKNADGRVGYIVTEGGKTFHIDRAFDSAGHVRREIVHGEGVSLKREMDKDGQVYYESIVSGLASPCGQAVTWKHGEVMQGRTWRSKGSGFMDGVEFEYGEEGLSFYSDHEKKELFSRSAKNIKEAAANEKISSIVAKSLRLKGDLLKVVDKIPPLKRGLKSLFIDSLVAACTSRRRKQPVNE